MRKQVIRALKIGTLILLGGSSLFGGRAVAAVSVTSLATSPFVGASTTSFTVSFASSKPGQGYVLFGSGRGCQGLVETATQDTGAGSTQHSITVTGNELPGTVGDAGLAPGQLYYFEVVTVSSAGVEKDDNAGKCYSVQTASTSDVSLPPGLTFQCFTPDNTFHQIFGPNSFFLNENKQGPTGFVESAVMPQPTVTFPLHQGTAAGHTMYYVITDASTQALATTLGVNFTPKLANTAGTTAVQQSTSSDAAAIKVPGDVDFSPARVVTPSATGFPPSAATAGAVGKTGYSPLVQLPDGTVINAPQIGDGTTIDGIDKAHWADKVVAVDAAHHTVTYDETNGCYEDQSVHYVSTDASDPDAAAIEDVTYAPALGNVPSADCGTPDVNRTDPGITAGCARESLIAFINGQFANDNVAQQGLNAAILNGFSPLNILEDVPNSGGQFNYSPMWDIHLVQWNDSVPLASRTRQSDFRRAMALVGSQAQSLTPNGLSDTFQTTGFIVDCPLISMFAKQ